MCFNFFSKKIQFFFFNSKCSILCHAKNKTKKKKLCQQFFTWISNFEFRFLFFSFNFQTLLIFGTERNLRKIHHFFLSRIENKKTEIKNELKKKNVVFRLFITWVLIFVVFFSSLSFSFFTPVRFFFFFSLFFLDRATSN